MYFAVIGEMVQAIFSAVECEPASITEIEVFPGLSPREWWAHLQPEQEWFVHLRYIAGEWWATQHTYFDVE